MKNRSLKVCLLHSGVVVVVRVFVFAVVFDVILVAVNNAVVNVFDLLGIDVKEKKIKTWSFVLSHRSRFNKTKEFYTSGKK